MAWYSGSWTYRIPITVDNTKVAADLTDFPVYVSLADLVSDFHTNVKTDGSDIRVTKSDGTTEVPIDLVFYDSGTDTGELHFKADGTLSSSVDTTFYIYYGNSGASAPAESATYGAQNVWKSAYTGVYHFQEAVNNTAGGYKDSTSNNRDGTGVSMAITAPNGKLAGKGAEFDGTADYITLTVATSNFITNSTHTVTAWGLTDVTGATVANVYQARWLWGDRDANAVGQGIANVTAGGGDKNYPYTWDGSEPYIGSTYSTATWNHWGNRHSGGTLYGYTDGAFTSSEAQGNGASTSAPMYVGNGYSFSSTPYWNGKIDELRFSNTDLGANWISTEYNNLNSPSTFYSDGAEEENPWDLIVSLSDSLGANGGTSPSIDTTGADLIVVSVADYGASTKGTLTDSQSNSWIELTEYTPGGLTARNRLFYVISPSTNASHTFTISGASTFAGLSVQAWNSVTGTPTYEEETGASQSTGATINTGSVTPAVNNALIVTGVGFNGALPTMSIDDAFIVTTQTPAVTSTSFGTGMAYKVQDTLSAENPTWTRSAETSLDTAVGIAVFQPTSVGGGTLKTRNGLAFASIKTINGLAIASVKTVNGLSTT